VNNLVVLAIEQPLEKVGHLFLILLRVCECVDVGAIVFDEGAGFAVLAEGVGRLLLFVFFEVGGRFDGTAAD